MSEQQQKGLITVNLCKQIAGAKMYIISLSDIHLSLYHKDYVNMLVPVVDGKFWAEKGI